MRVRRATASDLEAIGRLGALLMRVHYEFDRQRFMQPGAGAEGGYARFLSSQVDDDESLVLVAERDGQVLGYAYAAIEPQSWKDLRDRAGYIHDILVDEAHRGQAIAESLMEEMFAWMREHKLPAWSSAPPPRTSAPSACSSASASARRWWR